MNTKPDIKDYNINASNISFISTLDARVEAKIPWIEQVTKNVLIVFVILLIFLISFYIFRNGLETGTIGPFVFIFLTAYFGSAPMTMLYFFIKNSSFYRKLILKLITSLKNRYILKENIGIYAYEQMKINYDRFQKDSIEYEKGIKEAERLAEENRIKLERNKEIVIINEWLQELEGYIEILKHKRDYDYINSVYSIYKSKLEDYELLLKTFKHKWYDHTTRMSYFVEMKNWMEEKLRKSSINKDPAKSKVNTPIKKEVKTKPEVNVVDIGEYFSEIPNDIAKENISEEKSRKVNYAEQNIKNANIGLQGEEFVFAYEVEKLILLNRNDLAERVYHVSKAEGDGKGYDITSFNEQGEEIYIEVKTTTGSIYTQFFLSANELNVLDKTANYSIYRVFDFNVETKKGGILKIEGKKEIEKYFDLKPTNYKVVPHVK